MENSHLITYLLLVPLLGGVLLLFIGNKKENLIRYFALVVSISFILEKASKMSLSWGVNLSNSSAVRASSLSTVVIRPSS